MTYRALATDYDGTLAENGTADASAMAALRRLEARGCRLILVTGRELRDLKKMFAGFTSFDRVVAENGALMFDPESGKEVLLCDPVPAEFSAALQDRGIPVARGRAIVATSAAHQSAARALIRQLGLKLQLILNKDSAMILPIGVDKGSGVKHALNELFIPPRHVVAIGDAENDEALLAACGFGVAVANAVPALKSRARLVTRHEAGAGVAEAIARIFDQSK